MHQCTFCKDVLHYAYDQVMGDHNNINKILIMNDITYYDDKNAHRIRFV